MSTVRTAATLVVVGVAVALVGLFVDPLLVTPVGAAIAILSAAVWSRVAGPRETVAAEPVSLRDEERYSRRSALGRATVALGGLVGLAVMLPVAGFAVLPSFLGQRRTTVDLGPLDAFPEGRYTVVTFLADATDETSRRAAYVRNNGLLGNEPSFTVLSSRCTHVGCPTQPNGPLFSRQARIARTSAGDVSIVPAQPSGFGCPCHGSQFDVEGNRTAGPAPRALDRYEFSIREGRLHLGRLYSVSRVDGAGATARIHGFPLEGAGRPAAGLESWLYPLDPSS
ncbi:MAG TPA: Rieske 2Fe-2S domain-containing protein [Gaiellaceae bacterium]|nr:Rieske 2Fe-2S domain-containing protein [Gaiellaceae bacterium]